MNTVFIIDAYSKYLPTEVQDLVRLKFSVNGNQYAILEVPLEWGKPQLWRPIEEAQFPDFFLFNTFDEALSFIKELKKVNYVIIPHEDLNYEIP